MESNNAEGLFEISFLLAMLFFVMSMFVMHNPVLLLIFLSISVGFMITLSFLAKKERSKRKERKSKPSRIVPYL